MEYISRNPPFTGLGSGRGLGGRGVTRHGVFRLGAPDVGTRGNGRPTQTGFPLHLPPFRHSSPINRTDV